MIGSSKDQMDDGALPILTVGDLKSELSRWADETPVTFRSPLNEQKFRFYRYRPAENLLVLET
jgi:hypothetical protein